MDERTRLLMFPKESDEYETPLWLFNKLDNYFGFTLDPAASHLSHMTEHYFTIDDDGLSKPWDNESVFINPPYSKIGTWVDAAAERFLNSGTEVVMLVPARTETKYFHGSIWPVAHYVLFLEGRLKFINKVKENGLKPSSAPFPSVVVMYTYTKLIADDFRDIGVLINLWGDDNF